MKKLGDTKLHRLPVVERTFDNSGDFIRSWGRTITSDGMVLPISGSSLEPNTPIELVLQLASGKDIIRGRALVKACDKQSISIKFVQMTERSKINIKKAADFNSGQ